MSAFEVISGRVVNPGAAVTAVTMNTGDSAILRSFPDQVTSYLEQVWAQEASLGIARILSARMHDAAQGIRLRVSASARPLLPDESSQTLYPGDALTIGLSGGAAETDLIAFLAYYQDIPGISANLATWEEIAPQIVNIMGAEQAFTTGATAGDYGGSQSINADFDQFKRGGTRYALLGYLTDTAVGVVGVRGADTGNIRVGGPGVLDPDVTADWFVALSRKTGRPHIPIIQGDNVGTTIVDAAHTTAAVAINVTLIFAELARA